MKKSAQTDALSNRLLPIRKIVAHANEVFLFKGKPPATLMRLSNNQKLDGLFFCDVLLKIRQRWGDCC